MQPQLQTQEEIVEESEMDFFEFLQKGARTESPRDSTSPTTARVAGTNSGGSGMKISPDTTFLV